MKRILIIGVSGAGKSTFAQSLSNKLQLPLYHLDKIYWQEGWVPIDKELWYQNQQDIVVKEHWIIDGNYGGSFDLRFPKADTIIIFDIHPLKALFGALQRTLKYWRKSSRPDLNPNCPERFDFEFYRYILEFNRKHRFRIDDAIKAHGANKKILRFQTRKEANSFLRWVG